jgi:hypothetical protein
VRRVEDVLARELSPTATHAGAGGDDEGALGAGERGADGLDVPLVLLAVLHEAGEVVVEGAVDDGVGLLRAALERGWVFEVAAVRLGTGSGELLRAGVGAGEAEHLVPRFEKQRSDP